MEARRSRAARGRTPIFVDASGRRARAVGAAGCAVALACSFYMGTVGFSFSSASAAHPSVSAATPSSGEAR